jgi:hypothetical protein
MLRNSDKTEFNKVTIMSKNKILAVTISFLTLYATGIKAVDNESTSTNTPSVKSAEDKSTNAAEVRVPARKTQSEAASKTATFENISSTAEAYKTALDAHALAEALKQIDKDGAFKGTVTGIFEPRSGGLAIMNFDKNYRTALTALLKGGDFEKFPDLKHLVGKEALVTGKFISFQGRAEIVLTNTAQIKLVEAVK